MSGPEEFFDAYWDEVTDTTRLQVGQHVRVEVATLGHPHPHLGRGDVVSVDDREFKLSSMSFLHNQEGIKVLRRFRLDSTREVQEQPVVDLRLSIMGVILTAEKLTGLPARGISISTHLVLEPLVYIHIGELPKTDAVQALTFLTAMGAAPQDIRTQADLGVIKAEVVINGEKVTVTVFFHPAEEATP